MSSAPATPVFIVNQTSLGVLTAMGKNPETDVKIMEKIKPTSNTQLWKYEDNFLINQASDFVLEAPSRNHKVSPGTQLILNDKRTEGDNTNQKWTRSADDKFICVANPNLCIWGIGGSVQPDTNAVVDTVLSSEKSQKWDMKASAA